MKTIFLQVHNACPDVTRLYTLSGIDSGDIDKYFWDIDKDWTLFL